MAKVEYELDYMPVEVKRFLLDDKVLAMSFETFGVYFWLILMGWLHSGLPVDETMLQALLKLGSSKTKANLWNGVKHCFTVDQQKNKIINVRQEIVRKDTIKKHLSAVRRGRKGGKAKRSRAKAKLKLSPSKVKVKEKVINTPYSPPRGDEKKKKFSEKDAEPIYQAYPRHIGEASAIKAIIKALENCSNSEWLFRRVQLFAASPAGNNGKFTPHPATWFNRQQYHDDPSEWQKTGKQESVRANPVNQTPEQILTDDIWLAYRNKQDNPQGVPAPKYPDIELAVKENTVHKLSLARDVASNPGKYSTVTLNRLRALFKVKDKP